MSRSNFCHIRECPYCEISAYDLELCELQKKLFGARIAELNGGLGILTRALYPDHLANAKALMLDGNTLAEIRGRGI